MLENVTNITNLTSNAYTIAALVLGLWTWLVGIGAPVVVLIMFKYFANVTCDITLIHKNEKTSCKYPDNPIWLRHFFARIVVRIFTPWKKYDRSIEKWKESVDIANNELSSRVNEIENYKSPIDDDTWKFIESKDTLISALEKTISKDMKGDLQTSKLKIKTFDDGRCELRCAGRLIAYSYGGAWLRTLEHSLKDIVDDKNIIELYKNRHIAFQKMNLQEQRFKIKFAGLVDFVRMLDTLFSFKKQKYPEDINVK